MSATHSPDLSSSPTTSSLSLTDSSSLSLTDPSSLSLKDSSSSTTNSTLADAISSQISSPLNSNSPSPESAPITLPGCIHAYDPDPEPMDLIQIAPPLVTPETIQHIGQTPHLYPVRHGITVCDTSAWSLLCPPGTACSIYHDHAKCIPAIEAAFRPREIEYVVVPWPRVMNIIDPWLEKRGLRLDYPVPDQHSILYCGCQKSFYRVVQLDGRGFVDEEFGGKRLPTERKIREVLEDIEMEKADERRGVWTRENYADVYSDPDPIPGS